MTNTSNNTILVIGSTGKTGKRVADQLEARGIPVRHGSRSADIPFNWENPQTWAPAASRRSTSPTTPTWPSPARSTPNTPRTSSRRANLEWTIVRAAFFAQNFSEGAWLEEVLAGSVSLPVRDVQEPFVDAAMRSRSAARPKFSSSATTTK